jgi:hypothetical protein
MSAYPPTSPGLDFQASLVANDAFSITPRTPGTFNITDFTNISSSVIVLPSLLCPSGMLRADICIDSAYTPLTGCGLHTDVVPCLLSSCVWDFDLDICAPTTACGAQLSEASCASVGSCTWLGCVVEDCSSVTVASSRQSAGTCVGGEAIDTPMCGSALLSPGCVFNSSAEECIPLVSDTCQVG